MAQGRAAQAAGLLHAGEGTRPADRGVARDQAVQLEGIDHAEDRVHLAEVQVRRDLEQQWHAFAARLRRARAIGRRHRAEQFPQPRLILQFPQARGVRARDIEDEIIRVVGEPREAGQVILRRLVDVRRLGLAEIDPEGNPAAAGALAAGQAGRDRAGAIIVESKAVDHRLLGRIAEDPWPGVAGLRPGRDRPDFHMAKAQGGRGRPGVRILVETGGQTDRIRKSQPKGLDRPRRGREPVDRLQGPAERREAAQAGQ